MGTFFTALNKFQRMWLGGPQAERSRLEGLLSTAQRKVKTLEFLVARDAEPRIKLEEAKGVVKGLEDEQTRLIMDFTSRGAAQENRARALEVMRHYGTTWNTWRI